MKKKKVGCLLLIIILSSVVLLASCEKPNEPISFEEEQIINNYLFNSSINYYCRYCTIKRNG